MLLVGCVYDCWLDSVLLLVGRVNFFGSPCVLLFIGLSIVVVWPDVDGWPRVMLLVRRG
jgi:hypothetical protein